jgi:hypothetical protein
MEIVRTNKIKGKRKVGKLEKKKNKKKPIKSFETS